MRPRLSSKRSAYCVDSSEDECSTSKKRRVHKEHQQSPKQGNKRRRGRPRKKSIERDFDIRKFFNSKSKNSTTCIRKEQKHGDVNGKLDCQQPYNNNDLKDNNSRTLKAITRETKRIKSASLQLLSSLSSEIGNDEDQVTLLSDSDSCDSYIKLRHRHITNKLTRIINNPLNNMNNFCSEYDSNDEYDAEDPTSSDDSEDHDCKNDSGISEGKTEDCISEDNDLLLNRYNYQENIENEHSKSNPDGEDSSDEDVIITRVIEAPGSVTKCMVKKEMEFMPSDVTGDAGQFLIFSYSDFWLDNTSELKNLKVFCDF